MTPIAIWTNRVAAPVLPRRRSVSMNWVGLLVSSSGPPSASCSRRTRLRAMVCSALPPVATMRRAGVFRRSASGSVSNASRQPASKACWRASRRSSGLPCSSLIFTKVGRWRKPRLGRLSNFFSWSLVQGTGNHGVGFQPCGGRWTGKSRWCSTLKKVPWLTTSERLEKIALASSHSSTVIGRMPRPSDKVMLESAAIWATVRLGDLVRLRQVRFQGAVHPAQLIVQELVVGIVPDEFPQRVDTLAARQDEDGGSVGHLGDVVTVCQEWTIV